MSATIYYRKISKRDPYLKGVGSPSAFIDSMQKAFGWPCDLGPGRVPVLTGMAAVSKCEGYQELIDIINEHGAIQLYAEY